MAETALVNEGLTESMIRMGGDVKEALKKAKISTPLLLWLHLPDESRWRLLVVSDELAALGPSAAYRRLFKEVDRLPSWKGSRWVSRLTVKGAQDPIAIELKRALKRAGVSEGFAQLGLHSSALSEVYVY